MQMLIKIIFPFEDLEANLKNVRVKNEPKHIGLNV